jgi:hypothetical protein
VRIRKAEIRGRIESEGRKRGIESITIEAMGNSDT